MPSAVESETEAQLQSDANVIKEGSNALSNETDLRSSKVVYCLSIVERNLGSASTPAPTAQGRMERRKLDKKYTYLSDTDYTFSKDS